MKKTKSTLQPGENTIADANPTKPPSDGGKSWVIQWFGRLPTGGPPFGPKRARGRTKGDARLKAFEQWERIVKDSKRRGNWREADTMSDYIESEVEPLFDTGGELAAELAPNTVSRYKIALAHLKTTFGDMPLGEALTIWRLEAVLKTIASEVGAESARQARGVLSRRIVDPLVGQVIDVNPLIGRKIDLGTKKGRKKPAGGRALTVEEHQRVIAPAGHRPRRRPTRADNGQRAVHARRFVAKRRAAVDLTLLQAVTGLRITEARTRTWDDVREGEDGTLWVTVNATASKTDKGREVPVLDPRVSARLLERKSELGGRYVVGSPMNPNAEWDRQNCWTRTVKPLYRELATACTAPLLAEAGSHVWRTTLNTHTREVDRATRAAFFGHTEQVNERFYTDGHDVEALAAAYRDNMAV